MFRLRFLTAALVAAVAILASPSVSEAAYTFKLKIEAFDSSNNPLGSVELDDSAQTGTLSLTDLTGTNFSNALGIQGLQGTRSENFPIGTSKLSEFQTTLVNLTTDPIRVVITSSATYDLPNGIPNLKLVAGTNYIVNQTTGVNGTYTASFDKNGDVYGTDVQIFQTGTISGDSTTQVIEDPNVTWALTQVYELTFDGSGTVANLDGSITVSGTDQAPTLDVPAPAGLVMALGAVPFFGILRRRLRKTEVAA